MRHAAAAPEAAASERTGGVGRAWSGGRGVLLPLKGEVRLSQSEVGAGIAPCSGRDREFGGCGTKRSPPVASFALRLACSDLPFPRGGVPHAAIGMKAFIESPRDAGTLAAAAAAAVVVVGGSSSSSVAPSVWSRTAFASGVRAVIAVTLGGLGRMREADKSRDDGHEHRKGAQRRCDQSIAERGCPVQFARSCARVMGDIVRPCGHPVAKLVVSVGAVLRCGGRNLQARQSVSGLKKVSRLAPNRRGFRADTPTIFVLAGGAMRARSERWGRRPLGGSSSALCARISVCFSRRGCLGNPFRSCQPRSPGCASLTRR